MTNKRMFLTFGTPTLWMAHAQEARDIAASVSNALTRKTALAIAASYEECAEEARARIMGLVRPNGDLEP